MVEFRMAEDMMHWQASGCPSRIITTGQYVDIAPLLPNHAQQLFDASKNADSDTKFTWLAEPPPTTLDDFRAWVDKVAASEDPIFYAVIDKATGKVAGRQTLMRIDAANGSVEIGNIYWGPLISQQRGATEALFLAAKYVFDDLGYRRFEWKCNDNNLPSKIAAKRFGFQHEGMFRQHMIVKGLNRDTAWFSMTDKDWPTLRTAYEAWLDPSNFDPDGSQKKRLKEFR
jgi:RimJ/RimL family protein N-acetyltransferase